MTSTRRIFLVHATPVACAPIHESFARLWPEAELCNLLEDSLSRDLRTAGRLNEDLQRRFCELSRYAQGAGAHAILFTCSAFGEAIDLSRRELTIPVLKPDEAMIEEALDHGSRIGLLATFEPAIDSLSQAFGQAATARGVALQIESAACPQALECLHRGDTAGHDRLIAQRAAELAACDVVCFAQFSMTSAAHVAHAASQRPVLTTPDTAVKRLRRMLEG